jgi:hypothetical protein
MTQIESQLKLALDVGYADTRDPGVYRTAPALFLGQVQPWRCDTAPVVANYSLTDADSHLEVDATGGAVTLTLPAYVAYMLGRSIWYILRTDASANVVTVQRGSGSDTLNGGASVVLAGQWKRLQVYCTAANTFRAVASG